MVKAWGSGTPGSSERSAAALVGELELLTALLLLSAFLFHHEVCLEVDGKALCFGVLVQVLNLILLCSSSLPKPVCTAEWSDADPGYSKHALDKPLLSGSLSQPGAVQSYLQAGGLRQT